MREIKIRILKEWDYIEDNLKLFEKFGFIEIDGEESKLNDKEYAGALK